MKYITRTPSDHTNALNCSQIFPTKSRAINFAQIQAGWLNDELHAIGESAEPWRIQYISAKSDDNYLKWEGKNTIVVEQVESSP